MSIHTEKSIALSRERGGAAGQRQNRDLWEMPKRELIEIALHLAAICTDSYDDSLDGDGAANRIYEEREALRVNGII